MKPSRASLPLLWQQPGWPALRLDAAVVAPALGAARRAQGALEGKLSAVGFEHRQALAADAWSEDAVATAAIEGDRIDLPTVRSSVGRRLGLAPAGAKAAPRAVDGLLDVMDDAVSRAAEPLTAERLHAWQAALFPTGYSGITRIRVGAWRDHAEPMQIVSGLPGREQVHYAAPPSAAVSDEMARFLAWFEAPPDGDALVRAALAHLWFETIHPFEDGNGRVGRAIVDLVLARDAGASTRFIRLSQRLLAQRAAYYAELERAQHGDTDVTAWVAWFVAQVGAACTDAAHVVDEALAKARFWTAHAALPLTPRQRKVMNVLLDAGPGGFEGGMSTRKYERLTGASRATASRELAELHAHGLLAREGAGRAVRYVLTTY